MQSGSAALNRTCDQIAIIEQPEEEFLFVEQVQHWLEGEDSCLALVVGYGLCGLTALYLLGNICRAFWG